MLCDICQFPQIYPIYGHFHIFCDMSIKFWKLVFRNAVLLFKELRTSVLRKYNVLEKINFFDETPWVWIFNTDFCFNRSKHILNFKCNIWYLSKLKKKVYLALNCWIVFLIFEKYRKCDFLCFFFTKSIFLYIFFLNFQKIILIIY
jgi:hypothetical protein